MTNRAMLFGALYKLKVMHGQQTYSVCVGVAICVCVGVTMYIYINVSMSVCPWIVCGIWNASKATRLSPSHQASLSLWGVTFARLAATLDLYSFWETSGPVRQSLIKSTLQPQSATTCHNMLCLSFVILTLSRWVCWTSELVWLSLCTMLTW